MRMTLSQAFTDFVVIRSSGLILRVNTDEISWVQAARNSVRIHLNGESIILKSSLNKIEQQLNDGNFIRIHRYSIINVNRIRELRHWLRGTFQVFLQDGTQLLLSKSYRKNFFNFLCQPSIRSPK
jgi:two-component system, LytTR family, response regulator